MLSSLTFLDQPIKKKYEEMGQKFKRAADKDAIKTVGNKAADDQFRRDTFMRRDSIRVAISKHNLRRQTTVGTAKLEPSSFEDQKKPDMLGGLL